MDRAYEGDETRQLALEADDNIAPFTPYATTCNGFCAVAF